jgi:hypothetical protein
VVPAEHLLVDELGLPDDSVEPPVLLGEREERAKARALDVEPVVDVGDGRREVAPKSRPETVDQLYERGLLVRKVDIEAA